MWAVMRLCYAGTWTGDQATDRSPGSDLSSAYFLDPAHSRKVSVSTVHMPPSKCQCILALAKKLHSKDFNNRFG